MANNMRWRYGETNPVTLPVDSATEIEIGDLIRLDVDDAKPASTINDIGGSGPSSAGDAREAFHDGFVGVAMQSSRVGDTASIRIATSGVFEFDCNSLTFELGDRLGVEIDGANALEDQKVLLIPPFLPEQAIGRAAKRIESNSLTVLVEINSTTMRDGPQLPA